MISTPPNIDPKGSYTIAQGCAALQVHRRTLRRWEAMGLVTSHLNAMGRRKYEGRELIKLWEMNF